MGSLATAACETLPDNTQQCRSYAGKSYAGIDRKQKNLQCGERYDKTPVLYDLPIIGKKIRIIERISNSYTDGKMFRTFYTEGPRKTVYTVCHYTQGRENPLRSNNFMMVSYKTKSGQTLSKCVRTIDISLGILKVVELSDEEEIEFTTKKANNSKKGNSLQSVIG